MKTDREKLYGTLKDGMVTVKVPFNPLLLSVLGYFNCLKEEDKPKLAIVGKMRDILIHKFSIKL